MSGWRTVDLMVAATIGVVFGVVFWAWGAVFAAVTLGGVTPVAYLVSGMWLVPAVLAPLLIRRPGAGILAETVAALVSMLLGPTWGLDTILSGVMQGAGAEIVFFASGYRRWQLPVALLAGVGAALAEFAHDVVVYFPTSDNAFKFGLAAAMVVSGLLFAGLGSWLLYRALLPTGVLDGLASGRSPTRA